MKIQSFNISVPAPCMNRCKFCVASTRRDEKDILKIQNHKLDFNEIYHNYFSERYKDRDISYYIEKFEYVSQKCDTLLITSTGEPLMNKKFLEFIGIINSMISRPFRNIELQTSGLLLNNKTIEFLISKLRVKTISLSLSSLNEEINFRYNNPIHDKFRLNIKETCKLIKDNNLNLRLSLTLTDYYNRYDSVNIMGLLFDKIKDLGADQVTFKSLYESGGELPEDLWVRKHKAKENIEPLITEYIRNNGEIIRRLYTGEYVFSVHGIAVVINKDCMSSKVIDNVLRYVILKPNGKLYTKWDNPASLLF